LVIAFFGTPGFAVPTLQHLLRSPHRVAGVVTQPDRPSGRGQQLTSGPVKRVVVDQHIPLLQPSRASDPDFLASFSQWQVDLGVVAAYGKILPRALLEIPRLGMINVHASLLPKYRGAAPIQRAVMAGESQTGVTIMRIVQELDAGPMLAKLIEPIGPEQTSVEVEERLAFLGAALLVSVVDDLAGGRAIEIPQDPAEATYAPRLSKAEGLIDWTQSAQSVHNRIRGLYPWPHAFTYLDSARYIIQRSRVLSDRPYTQTIEKPQPGEILIASGDELFVQCGDTVLAILEIQPEGRRPLHVREFLAGHHLQPGQMFGAKKA
jgi:methionyl-tRNA formyltransferase